ncbi:MAG: lipocalin-like domain-containing protein, partial [Saprospiraceae bacterium]|nr:lipocalin-like domain-containing protein [Saprospiraceae bacterium]
MPLISMPPPTENLTQLIIGLWILQTREDYTPTGEKRIDPTLGVDPLGILSYGKKHSTAQFMKRDRSVLQEIPSYSGSNNTVATGGYDAYFGHYEVNEETGKVKHTLLGSIHQGNIGMSVNRDLRVMDDQLIIQLETTTFDGEAIIRTL